MRNLKPQDYVCAAFAFVGGCLFDASASAKLGPWAMIIGLPIMILAIITCVSLNLRDNIKGE